MKTKIEEIAEIDFLHKASIIFELDPRKSFSSKPTGRVFVKLDRNVSDYQLGEKQVEIIQKFVQELSKFYPVEKIIGPLILLLDTINTEGRA